MYQIPAENAILLDTIRTRSVRLHSPDTAKLNNSIAVNLVEFDDVSYRLTADAAAPQLLTVSLALPPQPTGRVALPAGAQQAVSAAYAGLATVMQPEPGFHLTLQIQLDALPVHDAAEFERALRSLARVRALVMGTQLRRHLTALADGTVVEAPLEAVAHRTGEHFFVKPGADAVTLVFPMRFKDASDATMACTFLAEFTEARRQPQLNTAPSCSYSKAPPLELRGAPAFSLDANGGYVSLVLYKRHVSGRNKVEECTWRLCTFYGFINYHIKCSKAHMHTRMRRRTMGLLQVLNRAKPDVQKAAKKADGRTFVRNI